MLNILKLQHVELQQLASEVTQTLPATKRGDKPTTVTLPAGSIVVRMDQPYARIADALLDRQYWAPDDPQKTPYDDTGWSFSELFNLKTVRITDAKFLTSKMTPLADPTTLAGKSPGSGGVYLVPNTAQSTLLGLSYKLKGQHISVTEKAFEEGGKHYAAGSLLISDTPEATLNAALKAASLDAVQMRHAPSVAAHPVTLPRIAFMHSWLATQTEGWWRYAFDNAGVPYDYISTQTAAHEPNLRGKYDVIVFAPIGRASTDLVLNGTPMFHNAMPWKKSDLTPNLGSLDQTDDIRPGLGYDGLQHLKAFVEGGGLLITCEDTAQFAIDTGLAPGVTVAPHADARVVGSVLNSVFVTPEHPVAWGYGSNLSVMSADGMVFNVSNTVGGRGGGRVLMDPYQARPTGRGSVGDDDVPQGRTNVAPVIPPSTKAWEPRPLNEEQMRNNPSVLPDQLRPEVVLRFSEAKDLLRSGLLDHGGSIAERAIVVVAHVGQGEVLLFGNNPVYRGETVGSYPLVFNAVMNFNHLQHLPPAPKEPPSKALPGPQPGVPSSQPQGPPNTTTGPDGKP